MFSLRNVCYSVAVVIIIAVVKIMKNNSTYVVGKVVYAQNVQDGIIPLFVMILLLFICIELILKKL